MAKVIKAKNKLIGLANSGDVGLPYPVIQRTDTGNKVIPIIVIIVPVTTGGNKRIKRLKYGAIRKVNRPATIMAP